MRKILCIFVCLMLLGGCEAIKEVEKEPLEISGFNTIVKSSVNNIEISAKVMYIPYKILTFTFMLPEAAKDMQVICTDGEYTINMNKVSFTFAGDKMPFNMLCRTLEACINNAHGATPEYKKEGELLIYTYSVDNHICKLYADKETKDFIKLNVDGKDVLLFENFEYTIRE